jgi:hypothetical protein
MKERSCPLLGRVLVSPKLPTILDNRGDDTVLAVLRSLLPETRQLDIATGVFDLGSLMALDGLWQKADQLRIVMGDETTQGTRHRLREAIVITTDPTT